MPERWRLQAACRGVDPNIFFPTSSDPHDAEQARSFCSTCPVQTQCRSFAVEVLPSDGIWAGHNHDELRKIRSNARHEQRRLHRARDEQRLMELMAYARQLREAGIDAS